jgi:2-hydroxychromene-2-carboxylate isomerase
MTLAIDLFWSFRSPYSYLATGRIVGLATDTDLDVVVRIVRPIAIRDPSFFARVDPRMPRYVLLDAQRVADRLAIPYRWPKPDPVIMDMETRAIAAEQPYIHRLNRLGIAAARAGRGLPFIDEVSRMIWSGTVDGWHEGDHLARAAERAGLDLAEIEQTVASDPAGIDAELVRNEEALAAAGHWGVPTLVFEGEPFFGQDRLEVLVWRLKQHGLAPRPG